MGNCMYLFSQQKGGHGERCDERFWGNGWPQSPSRTGLSMESVPWHEDVRDFAQQLSQSLPGYEIACEHEHSCSVLLAHRDRFFTPFGHWSLAFLRIRVLLSLHPRAIVVQTCSNYFQKAVFKSQESSLCYKELPSAFGFSSYPSMLFGSFFLI